MMKYIVDNMLVFAPDERLLHLKDNSATAVDIGIISARLFEVLLTHPEGVTRGYLLDSVWLAYGLKPTNSNLNNHISILRRNLASLTDMDDLITTLPKKGFVINRKYTVHQWDEEHITPSKHLHDAQLHELLNIDQSMSSPRVETLSLSDNVYDEPVNTRAKMIASTLSSRRFLNAKRFTTYIIGGGLCLIAAIMFYSWNVFMDRKSAFFQYNNCSFKPLRPVAQKDKQYAISLVMNHIYRDKINCSTDDYDIYFYFSGRDKQRSEFRFYSICRLDEKKRYASCHTARFS